jgi:hypothetical protein
VDVHKPIILIELALNDVVQDKAEHRTWELIKRLENIRPQMEYSYLNFAPSNATPKVASPTGSGVMFFIYALDIT